MPKFIQQFKQELFAQKYAGSTIKTYLCCLSRFLKTFDEQVLENVSEQDIECYLKNLINAEQISSSYQKQMLLTITKFYELFYNKHLDLSFLYPRQKKTSLPQNISQSEVKAMLAQTFNLKHSCILKLLYGSGLRVSEVLHLRTEDINPKFFLVYIRNAKGKRDRKVMLSQSLLADLQQYINEYRPKGYLFEGQRSKQYTAKSVQNLVKKAAIRAGINKQVTPYMLRHSFAIHLVENGTDIRHIQELLGHNSIKTTEIYTHSFDETKSRVKSPLDNLW